MPERRARAAGAGRAAGEAGRRSGPARATGKRQGLGGDQVEGRQAVRELLLAGRRRVREVWLLAEQDPSDVLDDIVELAEAERVPVRAVGRAKFFAEARCEAPQGVLAKAAPLDETPLEDLAAARGRTPPFLVAVDGVTDPGQPRRPAPLGRVRRGHRDRAAPPPGRARHADGHQGGGRRRRAPAGSPSSAASRPRSSSSRAAGVWVVGLDGDAPTGLWDLPAADGPIALVLGAEGSGLSRLVRQRCDELVSIPLNGVAGLTERERRGRAGLLRGRPRPRPLIRPGARIRRSP